MPRRVNFFRNNFLYPRSQPIKMPTTRSILVFIEIKQLCLLRNRTNYYSSLLTNNNVQNSIQNCFKKIWKRWSRFEKLHKCVFRLTKTAQYFIPWDIFVSATLLQSFARDAENSKFFRASSNMERIVYKSVSRTHLFIHWFDTKYELVGSRQANKYLLLKIIIPPSPFYHSYRLLCSNILC